MVFVSRNNADSCALPLLCDPGLISSAPGFIVNNKKGVFMSRNSVVAVVFLAALCRTLPAQEVRATLGGRVSDPQSAVVPDAANAAARRLQDWRAWIDGGLIDVVCPMAYTTDGEVFASQIAAVKEIAGTHPIWAGIGAYRLSSDQIVDDVQAARRLGAGGIILFSYDSLTAPPHGPEYLAHLARAAFTFPF